MKKTLQKLYASSWNHVFLLSNTQYDIDWGRNVISFRVVRVISASGTSYSRSVNPCCSCSVQKTYWHGVYWLLTMFISPLVNVHLDQVGWKSKAMIRRMQLYGLNDSNWGTSRHTVVTVRIGSVLFSSSSWDSWEVISHLIYSHTSTNTAGETNVIRALIKFHHVCLSSSALHPSSLPH